MKKWCLMLAISLSASASFAGTIGCDILTNNNGDYLKDETDKSGNATLNQVSKVGARITAEVTAGFINRVSVTDQNGVNAIATTDNKVKSLNVTLAESNEVFTVICKIYN